MASSQQWSWPTIKASCWWACTSSTRDMPIITLKNVQNNWEAHEFLQKEHTDCWRRLQRWFEALGLVSNESVLDRTHSKRVAKEEIGWSNGWWYRISQHSTRCTETLGKRTTHRSRTGTEQQIDYILIKRRHLKYTKTLKPKTWSTWAVTTDVSWQHFAINTKKEYTPMMQTKTNVEKQSRLSAHKLIKKIEKKNFLHSKKDIKSSK